MIDVFKDLLRFDEVKSVHLQSDASGNLQPVVNGTFQGKPGFFPFGENFAPKAIDEATSRCLLVADCLYLEWPWKWVSQKDLDRWAKVVYPVVSSELATQREMIVEEFGLGREGRTWLSQYDCLSSEYLGQLRAWVDELESFSSNTSSASGMIPSQPGFGAKDVASELSDLLAGAVKVLSERQERLIDHYRVVEVCQMRLIQYNQDHLPKN